jgi:tetratricopeptide (TPR) repeat protein
MAEACLGRALALKKLARHDDALASVDKAIDIKPDVAEMHEARASLLRLLGRDEEADTADTLAAKLATKNPAENSGTGTTP